MLDARRCISYLTIELKGPIPAEFHDAMHGHVYGCDICQEVCPYNHAAPVSADAAWQPRPAFDLVRMATLDARTDEQWRRDVRGSAMTRAGLRGLRRNLAAASGRGTPAGPDRAGGDLL